MQRTIYDVLNGPGSFIDFEPYEGERHSHRQVDLARREDDLGRPRS